ncbi:MAG: 1,4-dihydroxy-2-naphthoate polyprenyltransferase [Bacteroidetes bacterium]|nr:1,4-dihydroxy-2-naphthoate polyprenyltransferase [Bacteroidota bacterium]
MPKISSWIKAFRLRTLPLSFSSVILGSFLAYYKGYFIPSVLIGALLTTLFLQILSNLANDYGDTINGVDNHQRLGPKRGLQTGDISLQQMKWAVMLFTLLSLISGIWLLVAGTRGLTLSSGFIMLLIGLVAIAAAIKYTIGKKPYGYIGLGDFFVFLFFGLTGVIGTYFLHSKQITAWEFLPAISIGLFSTGVLNLNNLRDQVNDKQSGKITMVVKLGNRKGKIYHAILIGSGMCTALAFTFINYQSPMQFIYLIAFPLFIRNMIIVFRNREPAQLNSQLKVLSLTTLFFSITFGLGLIL